MSARPAAPVTGAGRGIGCGCAVALTRRGFDIVGNERSAAEGTTATRAAVAAVGWRAAVDLAVPVDGGLALPRLQPSTPASPTPGPGACRTRRRAEGPEPVAVWGPRDLRPFARAAWLSPAAPPARPRRRGDERGAVARLPQ
jgi:hypothetical protein